MAIHNKPKNEVKSEYLIVRIERNLFLELKEQSQVENLDLSKYIRKILTEK